MERRVGDVARAVGNVVFEIFGRSYRGDIPDALGKSLVPLHRYAVIIGAFARQQFRFFLHRAAVIGDRQSQLDRLGIPTAVAHGSAVFGHQRYLRRAGVYLNLLAVFRYGRIDVGPQPQSVSDAQRGYADKVGIDGKSDGKAPCRGHVARIGSVQVAGIIRARCNGDLVGSQQRSVRCRQRVPRFNTVRQVVTRSAESYLRGELRALQPLCAQSCRRFERAYRHGSVVQFYRERFGKGYRVHLDVLGRNAVNVVSDYQSERDHRAFCGNIDVAVSHRSRKQPGAVPIDNAIFGFDFAVGFQSVNVLVSVIRACRRYARNVKRHTACPARSRIVPRRRSRG